jgi:hypothetical protein
MFPTPLRTTLPKTPWTTILSLYLPGVNARLRGTFLLGRAQSRPVALRA